MQPFVPDPAWARAARECRTLAVILCCAGCAADGVRQAEDEAATALAQHASLAVDKVQAAAVRPLPAVAPGPAAAPATGAKDAPIAARPPIDLAAALQQAVSGNRDYKLQREALLQQALGFTSTRFRFGPQLDGTLAALFGDREDSLAQWSGEGRLGVQQILPTGGTLAVDGSLGFLRDGGGPSQWNSGAGLRLSQPLLRGGGYEVSHEEWTQAQRSVVYALREFELFRQRFAIDIAREYFELVGQTQTLANGERRYEEAVFDRRKAEALYSVSRNDEQQLFRARRREIETENDVIDARARYQRALDAFAIRLGLPTGTAVTVADQEPEFELVDMDDDSAVAAAAHNRLDLRSMRDRIDDAERAVRIADHGFLPDLNLDAAYGFAGTGASVDRAAPDQWSSSLGLSMRLPLQRTLEANLAANARIAREQAIRGEVLLRDQLDLEVRDQLRQLRSIEQQVVLQRDQIEHERRAVAITQIRYEAGLLDNRDLLEARQALIDAQNSLIGLKVNHFIRRLELHRGLGLLFIDAKGMWR